MSIRVLLLVGVIGSVLLADQSKNSEADRVAAQRESLSKLQKYVGQWRGVGQVRRGSRDGAWTETADCAWKLDEKNASLQFQSPKGKVFQAMTFEAGKKPGEYRLTAKMKSAKATYQGALSDDGSLRMKIDKPVDGAPDRLYWRLAAAGKRMILLYERKASPTRFTRIAEIGFTRKGSGFGSGVTYVECVVTGGEGTIPVRYEGKTYYVCCSGCKEYYDDDPDKAMKEYFARVEERKAKKP